MTASKPENDRSRYAPDGSHLGPDGILWQDLAKRSLETLANFTLARPLPEGRLQFRFLNQEICVDIPHHRLLLVGNEQTIPLEDPLLELVTLVYLNQVSEIFPMDRDIVGLQDLKESHFFVGPHELRTAKVLDRYGRDPEGFQSGGDGPGRTPGGHGRRCRATAPLPPHSPVFPHVVRR